MSGMPNDFNNPYANPWEAGKPQFAAPPKPRGSGAGLVIAIVLGVLLLSGCFVGALGVGFLTFAYRSDRQARERAAQERLERLYPTPTFPSADERIREWNDDHQARMREIQENNRRLMEESQMRSEQAVKDLIERQQRHAEELRRSAVGQQSAPLQIERQQQHAEELRQRMREPAPPNIPAPPVPRLP